MAKHWFEGRGHRSKVAQEAVRSAVIETLEQRCLLAFQTGINFQPYGNEAAVGYYPDNGDAYALQQNGLTYGWDANLSSTAAFDRDDANAADQRYDTGIDTAGTGRKWEIAVPNGSYKVRLVAGDAKITSGSYRYNLEGTANFLSGTATTGTGRWVSATGTVTVSDGKLTITNGTSPANTKLAFVEITEATVAASNTAPGAPSNVDATPRYSTSINVRWDDNADNEKADGGYQIQRKTGSGSWSDVGEVFGNARLFVNYTSVSANTTYSYRVRSVKLSSSNVAIYSAWSNEATVTTPSSDAQGPYNGTAFAVPGQIEVEDYDRGLNNAAYYDLGSQNAGGFYRSGNVDIGAINAENLFYVGWTETGEWQEYTTSIPVVGNYYVESRVSAGGTAGGGTFKVGFTAPATNPASGSAGTYQSNTIQVPNTNGFTNYMSVKSNVFNIGATGTQVMRMLAVSEDPTGKFVGNFDWVKVQRFDAPTALAAATISSGQINLNWTSNASAPTGFVIERKLGSGGTWQPVTTISGTTTNFQDTGLSASSQYFYRVKAVAGTLTTATSSEANANTSAPAVTAPTAPSNLTAALAGTQVSLAWTDNSNNETSFLVQRYANGAWTNLATLSGNVTTYTDTVTSGTHYTYRVSATDAGGTSAWSNSASVGQVTTISTTPTADIYVHSGTNATTNFGTATQLWTKGGTSGYERQAFLRFDLSSFTGSLTDIKLRLYGGLTGTEASNLTFAVKPVASTTWSESTTNWNNKPAITNTTLSSQVVTDTTDRWYEFDVTSYVIQEIALGHTSEAFAVVGIAASAPAFAIWSKESANQPLLLANVQPGISDLKLTNSYEDKLNIEWQENYLDETGYEVEVDPSASGKATYTIAIPAHAGVGTVTATLNNLDTASGYAIRVRPLGINGVPGEWSGGITEGTLVAAVAGWSNPYRYLRPSLNIGGVDHFEDKSNGADGNWSHPLCYRHTDGREYSHQFTTQTVKLNLKNLPKHNVVAIRFISDQQHYHSQEYPGLTVTYNGVTLPMYSDSGFVTGNASAPRVETSVSIHSLTAAYYATGKHLIDESSSAEITITQNGSPELKWNVAEADIFTYLQPVKITADKIAANEGDIELGRTIKYTVTRQNSTKVSLPALNLPLEWTGKATTTNSTSDDLEGFSHGQPSLPSEVVIPGGENEQTFFVHVKDDEEFEYLEDLKVEAKKGEKYGFQSEVDRSHFLTIADDDPASDVDIDSDRTNGINSPDRSQTEEDLEEIAGEAGKHLALNDEDRDSDGIPDFADGFNISGGDSATPPTVAQHGGFVPVVFEVAKNVDLSTASFGVEYDASDPKGVFYSAGGGYSLPNLAQLRLWKKDGTAKRNPASFIDGGDFIDATAGASFGPEHWAALGISDQNRTTTLFLEGVRTSVSMGGAPIKFNINLNRLGGSSHTDTVKTTVVDVDLLIGASNKSDYSYKDDWVGAAVGPNVHKIFNYAVIYGPQGLMQQLDISQASSSGSITLQSFDRVLGGSSERTPGPDGDFSRTLTSGEAEEDSEPFIIKGRNVSTDVDDVKITAKFKGQVFATETLTVIGFNAEAET